MILRAVSTMTGVSHFHAFILLYIAAYSFTHGLGPWNSALRVIRNAIQKVKTLKAKEIPVTLEKAISKLASL
jgi:hypothetical protein